VGLYLLHHIREFHPSDVLSSQLAQGWQSDHGWGDKLINQFIKITKGLMV
jgi:hypothetical protein